MADLRASDADRELIVDGLRAHHAAGRLDDAEFEQRLATALAARTRGELTRLVADLPPPAGVAPAVARPPDAVWGDVRQRAVLSGEWVVIDEGPRWLTLERSYRPWWVWLLVVMTFPLGLLALLIRERERAVLALTDAGEVTVTGAAADRVRGQLGGG